MKETKDETNRKVSIRPKCLRNLRKGKLYPKQKDKGFYLKTFSTWSVEKQQQQQQKKLNKWMLVFDIQMKESIFQWLKSLIIWMFVFSLLGYKYSKLTMCHNKR